MTTTLLLRLAGPMQSWGTQSRFRDRDTTQEPSKSGVIGLLCAALGRPREASVTDLCALRMGVRVDRPGVVRVDYQTAGGAHRRGETYGVARAENPGTETALSRRTFLADASFLVGLEANTPEQATLLRQLNGALAAPVWPLFLGRKSYVPSEPIRLPDAPPDGPGLREVTLEDALRDYPMMPSSARDISRARLVIECDATHVGAERRNDWPLSFESANRRFATRYVAVSLLPLTQVAADAEKR